ncbi:MAG: small subunit ribosomal protein [Solirubrobacteraceae bacterium]|jgi:small subunit ribosomal protein S6|nr:small subunit ribosomal protein [Solirubrobacteraceae bacterium]
MLLLDLGAAEEDRAKIVADTKRTIEAGGTLIGHHEWGARPLAYEIEHRAAAEYHLIQFHTRPDLLATLGHTLRITDGVVRHRFIKLAPGTPAPARPPAAESSAPAAPPSR